MIRWQYILWREQVVQKITQGGGGEWGGSAPWEGET